MVPCWDQRIVKQPFWCVYGDLWTRYFKMLSILSSSEHHKHSRRSIYFASDLKMVSRSRSIINIMKLWFQGPWFAPPCDIWKLQNVPGGEGSQAAITGFWYISQIDLRRKGPGSPSFHYFVVISFLSKKKFTLIFNVFTASCSFSETALKLTFRPQKTWTCPSWWYWDLSICSCQPVIWEAV